LPPGIGLKQTWGRKGRIRKRADIVKKHAPLPEDGSSESRPATRFAWMALIVVVVVATYWQNTRFGLIGFDSYPIIIASRIQSFGDLAGTFTEQLMDGRYSGDFYRPMVNLTFAFDYAINGIRPTGYHVTGLLIMIGCALALFGLMQRMTLGRATLASVVAALYFIIHPLQFEVVPVPPRRAEMLCFLFMGWSLYSLLSPGKMALKRPPLVPALIALPAYLSKEASLVLPVLGFFAVVMCSSRKGLSKRFIHGITASAGLIIALVIVLVIRSCVLGGIGGHGEESLSVLVSNAFGSLWMLNRLVLLPQEAMFASSWAGWMLGGIVVLLSLTCFLFGKQLRASLSSGKQSRVMIPAAVLGFLLIELVMLVYGADHRIEPWYCFIPVAGLAILLGVTVKGLATAIRSGRRLQRLAAGLSSLLLGSLVIWQLSYSPLIHDYDEYERATTAGSRFLAELEQIIEKTKNGKRVQSPPIPRFVRPRPDCPDIHGSRGLDLYSVQAWLELAFPDRTISVKAGPPGQEEPGKNEIFVHVTQALDNL
jgi:hypothetical protein